MAGELRSFQELKQKKLFPIHNKNLEDKALASKLLFYLKSGQFLFQNHRNVQVGIFSAAENTMKGYLNKHSKKLKQKIPTLANSCSSHTYPA
jgi:hypothetical protein